MFKKLIEMLRRHDNNKGFTLVELMVVVVIIGILTAIAIPVYNNVTAKAERGAIEANLRIIDGAIMQATAAELNADVDTPDKVETIISSKYLQKWPTSPGAYDIVGTNGSFKTYKAQVKIDKGEGGLTNGTYTLEQLQGGSSGGSGSESGS